MSQGSSSICSFGPASEGRDWSQIDAERDASPRRRTTAAGLVRERAQGGQRRRMSAHLRCGVGRLNGLAGARLSAEDAGVLSSERKK